MDDFFDRLDAQRRVTAATSNAVAPVAAGGRQDPGGSGIITGPGYAPAYPPYDVHSGQTTSAQ